MNQREWVDFFMKLHGRPPSAEEYNLALRKGYFIINHDYPKQVEEVVVQIQEELLEEDESEENIEPISVEEDSQSLPSENLAKTSESYLKRVISKKWLFLLLGLLIIGFGSYSLRPDLSKIVNESNEKKNESNASETIFEDVFEKYNFILDLDYVNGDQNSNTSLDYSNLGQYGYTLKSPEGEIYLDEITGDGEYYYDYDSWYKEHGTDSSRTKEDLDNRIKEITGAEKIDAYQFIYSKIGTKNEEDSSKIDYREDTIAFAYVEEVQSIVYIYMDMSWENAASLFGVYKAIEPLDSVKALNGEWKTDEKSKFDKVGYKQLLFNDGVFSSEDIEYKYGIYNIDFDGYRTLYDRFKDPLSDYVYQVDADISIYYYIANFSKEDIMKMYKDGGVEVAEEADLFVQSDTIFPRSTEDDYIKAQFYVYYYNKEKDTLEYLEIQVTNLEGEIIETESNVLTYNRL